MKEYYEATRKKPQTVGEFLKKTQDRNYASDQIYKHNMKEGATKLKMVGDKIYSRYDDGGYAPVSMSYNSNMELNALNAIRMYSSNNWSLAPSMWQLYEMRRSEEKKLLESITNIESYSKQDKQLKIKLLEHKEACLDKFQDEIIGIRDYKTLEACQKIISKETEEINWIRGSYGAPYYDFFNSEYARSFGFLVSNNPVNNPQNRNPEPDEEEVMLQALRDEIEKLKKEMDKEKEQKKAVIKQKDKALQTIIEKDQTIREKDEVILDKDRELEDKDKIISDQKGQLDKITNDPTTNADRDLVSKLKASEEKLAPLQERISELKIENKELKDDKTELREDKKSLAEDKKILQEDKKTLQDTNKLLIEEKKYYFDLSKSQETKIGLLEQIHCNDPEHDFYRVPATGVGVPIQPDDLN